MGKAWAHRGGQAANKAGLLTIGDMSRLFNTNVRTFRYYDSIGLLAPEFIDPDTGYRYYSTAQFERMNTIKYLRALDVPLAKIEDFFCERDVDGMLSIFEEQLAAVRAKQDELAQIERKIQGRIGQIEAARESPLGEVTFASMPARKVVALKRYFAPDADLEPLIRSLGKEHQLEDAIFLGKVGVSVSQEGLASGRFEELSSVFIVLEEGEGTHVGAEELAAGRYASLSFRGTHKDAAPAYRRLVDAIRALGLSMAGPSVEITVIDAGMTNDSAQFVTQLQIPVV